MPTRRPWRSRCGSFMHASSLASDQSPRSSNGTMTFQIGRCCAPTRRLAVHRNNMIAGLGNVLKGRFPVVEKIVSEEFFGAMAGAFVRECPPRSPVLASYGDELPEFIAAFAPARDLAYLADVARLEAAHTRAHHAADVAPLDVSAFATLDSSAINSIRLKLHPSVEIVRSSHPIVTIWAMNSGALTLAPIEDWRGEDALVARPHL